MRTATAALAPPTVSRPHLPPASVDRGHRLARCPRPDCGGRLLVLDVALDETAEVCMLCARTVHVWDAITEGRS